MNSDSSEQSLPEHIKKLADKCNPKHVRVVQAILSGEFKSNTKAYQSVYPDASNDTAKAEASKCLTLPNVSVLYSALKDEKLLEGIISRSEAMKILSDMASTSIGDLIEFDTYQVGEDDQGEPVYQAAWKFKGKGTLTEKELRSIHELSVTAQGIKVKQHDQKAAIKQLAEMMGWNEPSKVEVDMSNLSVAGDILYRKRNAE